MKLGCSTEPADNPSQNSKWIPQLSFQSLHCWTPDQLQLKIKIFIQLKENKKEFKSHVYIIKAN